MDAMLAQISDPVMRVLLEDAGDRDGTPRSRYSLRYMDREELERAFCRINLQRLRATAGLYHYWILPAGCLRQLRRWQEQHPIVCWWRRLPLEIKSMIFDELLCLHAEKKTYCGEQPLPCETIDTLRAEALKMMRKPLDSDWHALAKKRFLRHLKLPRNAAQSSPLFCLLQNNHHLVESITLDTQQVSLLAGLRCLLPNLRLIIWTATSTTHGPPRSCTVPSDLPLDLPLVINAAFVSRWNSFNATVTGYEYSPLVPKVVTLRCAGNRWRELPHGLDALRGCEALTLCGFGSSNTIQHDLDWPETLRSLHLRALTDSHGVCYSVLGSLPAQIESLVFSFDSGLRWRGEDEEYDHNFDPEHRPSASRLQSLETVTISSPSPEVLQTLITALAVTSIRSLRIINMHPLCPNYEPEWMYMESLGQSFGGNCFVKLQEVALPRYYLTDPWTLSEVYGSNSEIWDSLDWDCQPLNEVSIKRLGEWRQASEYIDGFVCICENSAADEEYTPEEIEEREYRRADARDMLDQWKMFLSKREQWLVDRQRVEDLYQEELRKLAEHLTSRGVRVCHLDNRQMRHGTCCPLPQPGLASDLWRRINPV